MVRTPILAAILLALATGFPAAAEPLRGPAPSELPGTAVPAASSQEADIIHLVLQRAKITRQLEAELEASVLSLLDQLVGPDRSLVRVKMDLDFNRKTVRNQLKAPVTSDGKAVLSDRRSGPDRSLHEITAFNLEDQTVEITPGSLRRLSVAVILPADLTAEAAERLRVLIATAVGADAARRDQVTVERYHLPARGDAKR